VYSGFHQGQTKENAVSCYEWEYGVITLPTAEVASVKKVVREAHNVNVDKILASARRIHKQISTRSRRKYAQAIWDYPSGKAMPTSDLQALTYLLWLANGADERVPAPTAKSLAEFGISKVTNRDSVIPVISSSGHVDALIGFEGRNVTWDVPENNHAADSAHSGVEARALFQRLNSIKWTRGTGGVITGNNEYNQEDRSFGGGSNYVVKVFGNHSV
jgi:hypothetical protein